MKAKITYNKLELEEYVETLIQLQDQHIDSTKCAEPEKCSTIKSINHMKYYFKKALDEMDNVVVEVGDNDC